MGDDVQAHVGISQLALLPVNALHRVVKPADNVPPIVTELGHELHVTQVRLEQLFQIEFEKASLVGEAGEVLQNVNGFDDFFEHLAGQPEVRRFDP